MLTELTGVSFQSLRRLPLHTHTMKSMMIPVACIPLAITLVVLLECVPLSDNVLTAAAVADPAIGGTLGRLLVVTLFCLWFDEPVLPPLRRGTAVSAPIPRWPCHWRARVLTPLLFWMAAEGILFAYAAPAAPPPLPHHLLCTEDPLRWWLYPTPASPAPPSSLYSSPAPLALCDIRIISARDKCWALSSRLPCIDGDLGDATRSTHHEEVQWRLQAISNHARGRPVHNYSSFAAPCLFSLPSCYRGIHDLESFQNEDPELAEAIAGFRATGGTMPWLHHTVDQRLHDLAHVHLPRFIKKHYGVFGLEVSVHNLMLIGESDPEGLDRQNNRRCEVHSDFHSVPDYTFTALVYFSTLGEDFGGGGLLVVDETAIDETAPQQQQQHPSPSSSLIVTRGLVIEPRVGRVVVFSGGLENLHCRQPVLSGNRAALQVWYKCGGSSSSAD